MGPEFTTGQIGREVPEYSLRYDPQTGTGTLTIVGRFSVQEMTVQILVDEMGEITFIPVAR